LVDKKHAQQQVIDQRGTEPHLIRRHIQHDRCHIAADFVNTAFYRRAHIA
jgi:hypothetical protein